MAEIHVYGAADIARVADAVRELGDGRTIPNRMARKIRKAVPEAVTERARENAVARLPRLNGFGRYVASGKTKALVRRGPRSAGVFLAMGNAKIHKKAGKRAGYREFDLGTIRHPSWGRRNAGQWHDQVVKAEFFTDAVEGPGLDEFRAAMSDAIGEAIREVGLG